MKELLKIRMFIKDFKDKNKQFVISFLKIDIIKSSIFNRRLLSPML